MDLFWEYINLSETHECGNWDLGRTIPRKGIHMWDFHCSTWYIVVLWFTVQIFQLDFPTDFFEF